LLLQPVTDSAQLLGDRVQEALHRDRAGRVHERHGVRQPVRQTAVEGLPGVQPEHRAVALGRGRVVGHDGRAFHPGLGQGHRDYGAGAVLARGAVHQRGAVAVGDLPQRGQHGVGPLEQEPEVEAGEPAAHRRQPLRQRLHVVVLLGKQRPVLDGDQRLAGHRPRPLGRYLDAGPQVDDRPHAAVVDEAADVGLGQVLEAVRAKQAAADGAASVGGGQPAGVARVRRPAEVDPVGFHAYSPP
jgi:hypothetical protein